MTASFSRSRLASRFRVRSARPSSAEKPGQHMSPHKAAGRSKDQIIAWSSENSSC